MVCKKELHSHKIEIVEDILVGELYFIANEQLRHQLQRKIAVSIFNNTINSIENLMCLEEEYQHLI